MKSNHQAPLAGFVDLLLDAICVVDREGRYLHVSAAYERIFGYKPEEVIGKRMIELVAPDDRERTLQAAEQIMSGQPNPHFENRYVRKDGQIVHIMWSACWSEADQARVAVAHDITERKQAEARQAVLYAISDAAHSADDLVALFWQIHQIIGALLPARGFAVVLSSRTGELSVPYRVDAQESAQGGRRAVEAIGIEIIATGQPLSIAPEAKASLPKPLRPVTTNSAACWLGVPLNSQNGVIGALILSNTEGDAHYTDADQELLQFVATQVATAVERQRLYSRLQHMAQYDDLTGLANRGLLNDRLKTALARAKREQGKMSLLYLDLNKFKQVNDTHGHNVGDMLLQEVARRLTHCVRESDTVARFGGDEFVVLLEHVDVPEHALKVVEKIRDTLSLPFVVDGVRLDMVPSIGIAHYPRDGEDGGALLKHADAEMYQEKHKTASAVPS